MDKRKSIVLILIFFLAGCCSLSAQNKLFTLLSHDSTGIDFINVINDTRELNVITYEYYYNGGGVAIGDVNNDGLSDIYFTSNVYECQLYLNLGNLKFRNVTSEAEVGGNGGYKTGVTMVDINNDGWLDIYLCKSVAANPSERKNILYVNNKNGTFTDLAAEYGVDDDGYAMSAYFNDTDGDSDLDLLILNHPYNLNFARTIHLTYNDKHELVAVKDPITKFESNRFFENVNGKYIDRTKASGLETRSFGLSAILEDFNGDGKTDIYQANDYLEPDYLFINKGNNRFINEFEKHFSHGSYSSMGSDYADINNDGFSDLITVDMLPEGNTRQKQLRRGNNYDDFEKVVKYGYGHQYAKNVLQLNNGNGSYSDISYYTGTAFSDWSWAVLMNDFDNDGWKDIYIANGYMRDITDMDYVKFHLDSIKKEMIKTKSDGDVVKLLSLIPSIKVQNAYFKNYSKLDFKKESTESGLDQSAWSFGAAYADLDNDGDLEIVLNNVNDYAFLYKNNTTENNRGNSVRIKFNGSAKNINGIGTKIESVTADNVITTTIFNPTKGYLSSNDIITIIGIGKHQSTNLTITWPDRKQQQINNVASGKLHIVSYLNAIPAPQKNPEKKNLFEDITLKTKVNYTHSENEFIDFKREPLLPHRFSLTGPCISVADFNGDNLDDFFVGGAKDREAKIFVQSPGGTFFSSDQIVFNADKVYEDGASVAADIDNDGDSDLLVTCGGNEFSSIESKYPVRLYINDSKGNFKKGKSSANFFTSSNAIAVSDLNNDGKVEIFIGGRVVPGHYGLIPKSFLLTVKGDSLVDITNTTALGKIGMVTTAVWNDLNNDGWADLVIAGEWMPVSVYYNQNGMLSEKPVVMEQSNGWWNHITVADINNDGNQDIVAGNLGMNTRYRGTKTQPVTMVASDFDNNGSTDCMISVFVENKSYPIAILDYVIEQMPSIRKKYLRYKQYSTATTEDIFTPEQLSKANKFYADNMYSSVFINDGNGSFTHKVLPAEAQLFPVNGILVSDVNADRIPDLLLGGNDYSTEVETGRNDAGIGLLLIGKGSGEFSAMPVTESGFYVPGDVKCMENITVQNKPCIIVGKNKDAIQVLSYPNKNF